MLAPSVYQYRYQQQAALADQQRVEMAIGAEVRALLESAASGDSWKVCTAKRKVRPSPAAFWRFIALITAAFD